MPPKDKRDIFYRKAKEEGWRARSAFKLLEIDEAHDVLKGVKRVVDLCAAPGSWSQVLSRRLYLPKLRSAIQPNNDTHMPKIVAVDLQPMAAIEGVHQIQGDITSPGTAREIIAHFHGDKADLVVCDGAPDVTGVHDMDEYIQAQLILAALIIVISILKPDGAFVAKIFRQEDASLLYSQLKVFFTKVDIVKPKSSRSSSNEAFVVCKGFQVPEDFEASRLFHQHEQHTSTAEDRPAEQFLLPYLVCGDLSGWNACN